jgi:hypothetical protein
VTPGLGIFLIVVGAIIRYALDVEIVGVEEDTLGLILILGGLAIILLWLVWLLSVGRRPAVDETADPRYRRY